MCQSSCSSKIILVNEEEKSFKDIDQKLVLVIGVVVRPLTQIRTTNYLHYIIDTAIVSTPNQDTSRTGIDRKSMKAGLHG